MSSEWADLVGVMLFWIFLFSGWVLYCLISDGFRSVKNKKKKMSEWTDADWQKQIIEDNRKLWARQDLEEQEEWRKDPRFR